MNLNDQIEQIVEEIFKEQDCYDFPIESILIFGIENLKKNYQYKLRDDTESLNDVFYKKDNDSCELICNKIKRSLFNNYPDISTKFDECPQLLQTIKKVFKEHGITCQ